MPRPLSLRGTGAVRHADAPVSWPCSLPPFLLFGSVPLAPARLTQGESPTHPRGAWELSVRKPILRRSLLTRRSGNQTGMSSRIIRGECGVAAGTLLGIMTTFIERHR